MSVILKLRMLSDEDDCFLRDYEVPYESTLEELHDFICNDLQYEKIPESSFFEADREWNRRREYTHADAGATGSDSSASRCRMSENRLSDILHRMQALSPLLLEAIPLTLEEIFIYELGGADYAVREIIL